MSTGEVYYADDGTMSMVLDAKVDPNYEPTQKELEEYAQWLGIDLEKEKELMFLAREGLKAPLPEEWKPCKTDTGDVYYFNFSTGESIWEHPLDDHFKQRLEEERGKLRAGLKVGPSADDGKKKKKKEDKRDKKLEKGSAGNEGPKSSYGPPASAGASVPPVKGRLGALGDGPGSTRPDITGLIPESTPSTIPKSFALPSKEPASKDTAAEDDQRLKESLRAEHDDHIRKLQEQHDDKLKDAKAGFARELARLEKDLEAKHADEVDDARRAAERRSRRELQMYSESIDRQLDDLRRTLKQERARRDAEAEAIDARVESELNAKRRAADAKIEATVANRVAELHSEWHAEQNRLTEATETAINSMRQELAAKTAARERQESDGVSQRLRDLDDELGAEERQLRNQLAQTHQDTISSINASAPPGDSSPEYAAAEERYAQAVAAAKAAAAARGAQLRESLAARKAEATTRHRERLDSAKQGATAQLDSARATKRRELKAEASERVAAALEASEREHKLQVSQFKDETASMVDSERASARSKAVHLNEAAANELAAVTAELEKQHADEIAAANNDHAARLAAVEASPVGATSSQPQAASLESRKSEWLALHPEPARIAPEGSAQSVPDVAAVKARLSSDNEASLRALEAQLEGERRRAVDAHRAKAEAEMERRVEVYASERQQRAMRSAVASATTSPQRRVVAANSLSRDSERALADERARLQAHLDSLALELASAQHPPRPSSALGASRDLPNLRSSGSSRMPSGPPSPERPHHHAPPAGMDVPSDDMQRRMRRIQKAKAKIRAEKQTIRQRQVELENARAEWRRDMREAKDRNDRKQQQLLHVAKGVLEERARVLNHDTAELRQSIEMVKEEERRLGVRDSSDGARVYEMLKAIAAKVEHVEARLTHSGSGRRAGSPRRETAEKWQRYMRPTSGSGSRHVDVEMWLDETSP